MLFRQPQTEALVSVVIPVRADPKGLRETLESLVATAPSTTEYEVVVANDGGDSRTAAACGEFASVKTVVLVPNRGPGGARNAALAETRGSVVAFLDANVVVNPGWWEAMLGAVRKYDVVGGRVEVSMHHARGFWHRYDSLTAFDVPRYVANHHVASCNMAVRRSVIEECGGFDERFRSGEDTEFSTRVWANGGSIGYAHDMVVSHPSRGFTEQRRKLYRIVVGRAELASAWPDRFGRYRLTGRLALSLAVPPRSSGVRSADHASASAATRMSTYLARYAANLYTLAAYIYVGARGTEGRHHDLS